MNILIAVIAGYVLLAIGIFTIIHFACKKSKKAVWGLIPLVTGGLILFIVTLMSIGQFLETSKNLLPSFKKEIDHVSGCNFTGDDSSFLKLNEDGTFIWYKYKEEQELTDDYASGNYFIYIGDHAIDFIEYKLPHLKCNRNLQIEMLKIAEVDISDYYCLVLRDVTGNIDGNHDDIVSHVQYYGFYCEGDCLALINMENGTYTYMTKEE
ncbi:MAG: hypothetical protein GX567_04565 [Clostridia bacterium]|nr:hypothetical protein [Clostridia bacterium]